MASQSWTLDRVLDGAGRGRLRPPPGRLAVLAALGVLGLAALAGAQVQSPPPAGPGFQAILKSGGHNDPDVAGAVGEDRVIAVVNSRLRVQDKTGVERRLEDLGNFWPGTSPVAPRIVYCPDAINTDSLWVIAAFDQGGNKLLLSAYKGLDPSSDWGAWSPRTDLDIGSSGTPFIQLGFNKHWVAVLLTQPTPFAASLFVFDRAQLRLGSWTLRGTIDLKLPPDPLAAEDQMPAVALTYGTGDDLYLVRVKDRATGTVRLLKVTSAAAPLSPSLQVVADTTLTTAVPPGWAPNIPSLADQAPQLRTDAIDWRVNTGDDRVQNVVVDESGDIWATNTAFLAGTSGPRSAVQWWAMAPNGSLLRSGRVESRIDNSTRRYFAYPQIAVNASRDALLAYNAFSPAERVASSYSMLQRQSDGSYTQLGDRTLKVGSGVASYGAPCSPAPCTALAEWWGRYNAATRDPTGPGFWTLQELPTNSPDREWETWWGRVDPRPWVTVSDAAASEPPDGVSPPGQARFKVALSWPSSQPVQVDVVTNNVTATAPGDYGGISSRALVFAPGETQRTVDVPVYWDGICEPSETFSLVLSSPVNAWLGEAHAASLTATGTIVNDPAPPTITIQDERVLEQSGGPGTWDLSLTVTASAEPCFTTTVNYATRDGSAKDPSEYRAKTGAFTFGPSQPLTRSFTVKVVRDNVFEPEDKQFYVDLSIPGPAYAVLRRSSGVVTILDDDQTGEYGQVTFLTVTSDSGASGPPGRTHLRWRNPVRTTTQHVHVRWDDTGACPEPAGSPCLGTCNDVVAATATNGSPELGSYDHQPPVAMTYCYAVFAGNASGSNAGPTTTAYGYPGDGTGAVQWRLQAYAGSSLGSPSIGKDSVLALLGSELHAVVRDPRRPDAGTWPSGWNPVKLGSMADQLRFPILPVGDRWRAFIATGTSTGRIYSVDAQTGAVLWTTDPTPAVSGAPAAGYFRQFGGSRDLLFVGTRTTSIANSLLALDPFTGLVQQSFPLTGDTGLITTAPIVDYVTRRVIFSTWDNSPTNPNLFCVQIGDGGAPFAGAVWQVTVPTDGPPASTRQRLTTSPVLRNGRIYVGDEAGVVYSLRASDGGDVRRYRTGSNASVLGFLFPDRSSDAFYFTSGNKVYKVVDNDVVGLAATQEPGWPIPIDPTATMPLFFRRQALPGHAWTASGGSGATKVFRVESGSAVEVADLKVNVTLGQPTLDAANETLYLGTAAGSLFAVSVNLP